MIRKLLFLFFFFLGISIISIIFLPSLIMPTKIVLFGGKMMGRWAAFCLQIFLQTKIIVKGRENIIKNEKFFISCSHQSMFETFYLQTIFNSPIFILKYELIKIPIFGWYLKKIGSISINRNKISKNNLGLIQYSDLKKNGKNKKIVSPNILLKNKGGAQSIDNNKNETFIYTGCEIGGQIQKTTPDDYKKEKQNQSDNLPLQWVGISLIIIILLVFIVIIIHNLFNSRARGGATQIGGGSILSSIL